MIYTETSHPDARDKRRRKGRNRTASEGRRELWVGSLSDSRKRKTANLCKTRPEEEQQLNTPSSGGRLAKTENERRTGPEHHTGELEPVRRRRTESQQPSCWPFIIIENRKSEPF